MAIVFISPKEKQKVFFGAIAGVFGFIVIVIAIIILLSRPAPIAQEKVFKKPPIKINFALLDSDKLKNLQPFPQIEAEFTYTAKDAEDRDVAGKITAASEDDARKAIEAMNLKILTINGPLLGQDNPFTPYVLPSPTPTPKPTPKNR